MRHPLLINLKKQRFAGQEGIGVYSSGFLICQLLTVRLTIVYKVIYSWINQDIQLKTKFLGSYPRQILLNPKYLPQLVFHRKSRVGGVECRERLRVGIVRAG